MSKQAKRRKAKKIVRDEPSVHEPIDYDAIGEPRVQEPVEPEHRGIPCRNCGCEHHHVVYVRKLMKRIVRRRECRNCGERFTTSEEEKFDA